MAGASVATIMLGFNLGGWSGAGGVATAEKVATAARTQLSVAVCADNFASLGDARARQVEIMAMSDSARRSFVTTQDWAVMPDETRAPSRHC